MSPRIVIARMKSVIEKYGYQAAASSGRFKKEREAWTSGIFALGLSEMDNKEYWVEIETEEQTPDTKLHYIDQSAGRNVVLTQSIEIVDWEEHVPEAIEVVKQKCRRAYPPYFCLLLLARNGGNLDIEMLSRQVASDNVPFAEIWVLGCPAEGSMTMVRVVPEPLQVDFEIVRVLEKLKGQRDFMVRQKRGTSTTFQDLGFMYLPLP